MKVILRRYLLALVPLLVSTPSFAQRLPVDVVPEHYDIAVTPNLQAATFSGTEKLAVKLAKPTATIVLNAAEITFDTVTVSSGAASSAPGSPSRPPKSRRRSPFHSRSLRGRPKSRSAIVES